MSTLITVGTDGSLTQIRPSKGKGLDLRKLGPIEMRRSSLIEFDEAQQAFYVRFIDQSKDQCHRPDGMLCELDVLKLGLAHKIFTVNPVGSADDVLYFAEYEDGVAAEVLVLEMWRRLGLLIG